MGLNVVVWGTGNVGRPAIRSVLFNKALNLSGVIVSNPDKDGIDAGDIAGVDKTGILATRDWESVLKTKPDAVVYVASADMRPMEAMNDLLACLKSGANVVSTAFYTLLFPAQTPPPVLELVEQACEEGKSSLFINGIDPGWALDVLPAFLTGMGAGITEIRCQETFNYALYDQPDIVRNVIGFGKPMTETPLMLSEYALKMVWEPMIRVLGERLDIPIDGIETHVERLPLEADIDVPGMGMFEKGTQGAFRFEVRGISGDARPLVVEHITRIDDKCAPDWPSSPAGSSHNVLISGYPNISVIIHAQDPVEPGAAGGGNATAANRVVNAIEAVCASPAGIVTANDLPPPMAKSQIVL